MLNKAIENIPIPARMVKLPISDKGFPVPWFVAKINGEWDFRVIGPGKVVEAYRKRLCWLCGGTLGQYLAFTIGPMCSINRVSSEPPSHRECAEYAVRACPFLSKPRMRRNDTDMPVSGTIAGNHLDHNPGATLIWITKSYRPIKDGRGGTLFNIGPPISVHWYAEGQPASRAQVDDAIKKGLPFLRDMAAAEGPEAIAEMERMVADATKLLPAE